jgi:hypothetical protein
MPRHVWTDDANNEFVFYLASDQVHEQITEIVATLSEKKDRKAALRELRDVAILNRGRGNEILAVLKARHAGLLEEAADGSITEALASIGIDISALAGDRPEPKAEKPNVKSFPTPIGVQVYRWENGSSYVCNAETHAEIVALVREITDLAGHDVAQQELATAVEECGSIGGHVLVLLRDSVHLRARA